MSSRRHGKALTVSIAANVALLATAVVLTQRIHPEDTHRSVPAAVAATPHSASPRNSALTTGLPLTPLGVAKLGQEGVSRDTVAAVIIEDLNLRSGRALLALQKKHGPKPVPEHEQIELSRQTDEEQKRELIAAFGEEGYRSWDKEQTLSALNPAGVKLTDVEEERAYELQKAFDEKNQALIEAMQDGVADKADVWTLQAQAQTALNADLRNLLGEARFASLRAPEARSADPSPGS